MHEHDDTQQPEPAVEYVDVSSASRSLAVSVVLSELRPIPYELVPPLAEAASMARADATRAIRRQRGILVDGVAEATGDAVTKMLSEHGIEAETVATALLPSQPRPRTIYHLEPTDDGLHLPKEPLVVSWLNVRAVAIALVVPESDVLKRVDRADFTEAVKLASSGTLEDRRALAAVEPPDPSAAPAALADLPMWLKIVAADELAKVEKELPELVIDLLIGPAPSDHYRISARELMASPLGADRSPNWLRNAWIFAQRIAEQLGEDAFTPGMESFLRETADWTCTVDLRDEIDNRVRWLQPKLTQQALADPTPPTDGKDDQPPTPPPPEVASDQ